MKDTEQIRLWLDVADKAIKAVALLIGGLWTYWNFKKSRLYSKRLDLMLSGTVFQVRGETYVDFTASIKNVGAARHSLDQEGTYCELRAIYTDLSDELLYANPIFQTDQHIEPSTTVMDRLQWHVVKPSVPIVWFEIRLRVISDKVEWKRREFIRAQGVEDWSSTFGL